jgi:hypothetical protein
MHDWLNIAQRMKDVREAGAEFMVRSEIDAAIIGPMLLDRVAADLKENSTQYPAQIYTTLSRRPMNADDLEV